MPRGYRLSKIRPWTYDDDLTLWWFKEKGFSPEWIARELWRPLPLIEEKLQDHPEIAPTIEAKATA